MGGKAAYWRTAALALAVWSVVALVTAFADAPLRAAWGAAAPEVLKLIGLAAFIAALMAMYGALSEEQPAWLAGGATLVGVGALAVVGTILPRIYGAETPGAGTMEAIGGVLIAAGVALAAVGMARAEALAPGASLLVWGAVLYLLVVEGGRIAGLALFEGMGRLTAAVLAAVGIVVAAMFWQVPRRRPLARRSARI